VPLWPSEFTALAKEISDGQSGTSRAQEPEP